MIFISYAQNYEDVMLWRALRHVKDGFYIDVGAGHPVDDSVTKSFYDRGWRGINVEPLQSHFRALAAARPRDLNLNVALAAKSGERQFFEIEGSGLSTLDEQISEQHRASGWTVHEAFVETTTLAEVCRQHVIETVHFLKVDVEGAEEAVLAGADFSVWRPWIVLVEATHPLSTEQSHEQWERLLTAADYRFVWFDGLNRFYVAAEQWNVLSPAFTVPPNVFDDFIRAGDTEQLNLIISLQARAGQAEARAMDAESRTARARAEVERVGVRASLAEARATRAEAGEVQAKRRTAEAEALATRVAARAAQDSAAALDEIAALRATTSWRLTAPLRAFKLALRGQAGLALVELGVARPRVERMKRVGGSDGNRPKQAFRIAFYIITRTLARIRGATAIAASLERLAPGPWNWLRRRNQAYVASAVATIISRHPVANTVGSVAENLWALDGRHHASHRTRIVHQFHSGSSTGDAITNSMFLLQRWLQEHGYKSDIFVEYRHPRLADRLREIGDLPLHGDYVLIVHHSFGYDACHHIASLPARKILMYHNITPPELLSDFPEVAHYAKIGRQQLDLLRPHMLTALADSEFNALELQKHGYDSPVACCFLFDIEQLLARHSQHAARPEGAPLTILFVGRVVASKGQADLVDAFAAFRRDWAQPCRLVLVGRMADLKPVYPTEIRRRIALHGLEAEVLLTGPVTDDELFAWYNAADIYVSLSHHEGFGVPLVEAMAHGIPVIAWPAGAVPYTLGGAAVLLADRAPAAVAAAMLRVATDAPLRNAIVARQRRVLDRFRLDTQTPRLIQALATAGAAPPPNEEFRRALTTNLHFTITGHVNWTYSLSSVNREMALALEARRPGTVRLLPVEGVPTSDISQVPAWHINAIKDLVDRPMQPTGPEVVISQHYPVHVPAHRGDLLTAMVFWEESLLPAAIVDTLNDNFAAVLAPSSHVAKVLIDSGLSIPAIVAGYAPDLGAFYRLGAERIATPREIGQPVTFLHVSSCFPRKGVDVLLAAYAKAFRKGDPVRLVIKGFPNPHNDVPEQIDRLHQRDPMVGEITMINGDLTQFDMLELYRTADAMVLPSRGEGFNIPAAEAMAAALPLIVVREGGHLDFCTQDEVRFVNYQFGASRSHLATFGSVWLEPDVEDLAAALREEYDDILNGTGKSAVRAARARKRIRERLDPSVWADRLLDASVGLLMRQALPPPKVAWVSSWGVSCGVAEYSRFLINGLMRQPGGGDMATLILCDDRTPPCSDEGAVPVHPTWRLGDSGNMDCVARAVANADVDVLVIQYHDGLFRWQALAALLADPRVTGRLTVVTLHAAQRLADLAPEERSILTPALGRATRVLVHRIADLNLLKSYGLTANVTLMPQGAPPLFVSPSTRRTANSTAPIIGCYGFFLPGKGINRLIQAVAQLRRDWPDLRLRLVNAEYPYVDSRLEIERCRNLAASLGMNSIIEWETEFRPQDESLRLLSECDLLVLPYDQSKESSSAALRGALSSGAPVAVTPVALFDEAGDAVFRFGAVEANSVAEGIDLLLRDEGERNRLRQSAAVWLAERDWDRVAQRMAGMLTGLHQVANTRALIDYCTPEIGPTGEGR